MSRWAELIARECPAEFKQDIESMIAQENKLESASNMEELMRQRGKVEALKGVLFKVTSLIQPERRR